MSRDEHTIGLISTQEETFIQHIMPVNKYDDPVFGKMYLKTVENDKPELVYAAKERNDSSRSYVRVISEALGDRISETILDSSSYSMDDSFYTSSKPDRVVNYVEYEDAQNRITDTIRYFSKTDDTMTSLLSPDTYYYTPQYSGFSLFGFESLGWRYSTIVAFKKFSDYLKYNARTEKNEIYAYVMFSGIDEVLRYEKHPLVKTRNDEFKTIMKQTVKPGYLTDNIILQMTDDWHLHTQSIVAETKEVNTIMSPYNTDGFIVDFYEEPFTHNSEIALFNPESASVCVMGILSVKDIDMSVNLD